MQRLGRFKDNECECTDDEVYDRARCRDAAKGECTHRLFTAFKMYRREHERFSTESEAGSAVSNRLMQDVRRGISDERNRGDGGDVREREARLFGDHLAHDAR